MTKVNPKVEPCAFARQVEAEIRENGGWLTAEEWEFTAHYEMWGWSPTKAGALRMAKERNGGGVHVVAGSTKAGWHIYRTRDVVDHEHT